MGDNTKMKYTVEKADEICALIVDRVTIRDICAMDGMPSVSCFFKWLRTHPEFEKQYAQAKEIQAEIMAEEMEQIADDGRNDWMEKISKKTGEKYIGLDHEHVQRSKLRIDTRKWLASKLKAKKYGDRLIHAGDEEAPLTTKDVSETDRKVLARFLSNHSDRIKPTQEEKDEDYDDIC